MKKVLILLVAALIAGAGWLILRDLRSGDAATAAADGAGPTVEQTADPASDTTAAAPERVPGASLLWRRLPAGDNLLWHFGRDGAPFSLAAQAAGPEWVAVAHAPGGWGEGDVVAWRNDATGELRLWQLLGEGEPRSVALPPADEGWRLAALADADGDGDADLVWVRPGAGVAVWTLQDGAVDAQAVVGDTGAGWRLAEVADFDADGRADLFWRREDGTAAAVWSLDGRAAPIARGMADAGAEWRLLAAAALDDARGADLLWQDAAGNLVGWSGADSARSFRLARAASEGWTLVGTLDTTGDGRAELLWRRDADGTMGAWSLGAEGEVTDLSLPPVDTGWQPVPRALARP